MRKLTRAVLICMFGLGLFLCSTVTVTAPGNVSDGPLAWLIPTLIIYGLAPLSLVLLYVLPAKRQPS
jgi:hypothetical protein